MVMNSLKVGIGGATTGHVNAHTSRLLPPSVARTFLSAHVHEGRQECLPHNTTLHRCG
jgi:hypothetical protein